MNEKFLMHGRYWRKPMDADSVKGESYCMCCLPDKAPGADADCQKCGGTGVVKSSAIREAIAELRAKNGARPCGCEPASCDCGNSGDTYGVGSWDWADWVLNEIEKAIK